MNYKCDTTMLPRSQLLRVCFSCWRNVPVQVNTSTFSKNLLCSNSCGRRWKNVEMVGVRNYSDSIPDEHDITQNPYFDKYKAKLSEKQNTAPEEFQSRLEDLKEQKAAAIERRKQEIREAQAKSVEKPSIESPTGTGNWPPRNLSEIMKVDLIKDKSTDEIRKIWSEYYAQKDCIFGVVEAINYESLVTKSKACPHFIYPLARGDGYEYYFSQIHGKDVYFTSLGMYQLLKENAPPCLTVAHFAEFADDKAIVLMAGQYDSNTINKNEAVTLVTQMSAYYNPGVGERFNLVRLFNHTPEKFKHLDTIEEYKKIKHTFPS